MITKNAIKNIIKWLVKYLIEIFNIDMFNEGIKSVGIDNGGTLKTSGEESFIINMLPKLINKNPIIFDIGAHIGEYTDLLNKTFSEGKIYCFEPNPIIYEKLKDRVKDKKNCIANKIAISDSSSKKFDLFYSDKIKIYDHTQLASGNEDVYRKLYKTNNYERIVCESENIDYFCEKNHIDKIDFMKIDTEGNELNVLKGASKMLLSEKIKMIQFEFNEMNILSRTFLRDFEEVLKDFDLFRLKSNGKLIKLEPKSKYNEIFVYQNIVAMRN